MTSPKPLKDFSLWSLVLSNLITIVIALVEQWSFITLMWVYWFQSVIIGVFNIVRMLQLKKFSTEGFTSNGKPVPPTRKSQIETAVFFFFHYGFFHFGYLIFIWGGGFGGANPGFPVADAEYIAVSIAVFLGNHLLSYVQHKHETEDRVLNLGALMFYPYLRIIPMHLTIIFGGMLGTALPVFLILKALADTGMHYVEHAVLMGTQSRPRDECKNVTVLTLI